MYRHQALSEKKKKKTVESFWTFHFALNKYSMHRK